MEARIEELRMRFEGAMLAANRAFDMAIAAADRGDPAGHERWTSLARSYREYATRYEALLETWGRRAGGRW